MPYDVSPTPPINSVEKTAVQPIEDYSLILDKHNISYSQIGYHLQVGEITRIQGWILHISVVRSQIPLLLEIVLPVLVSKNICFKIVKDKEIARSLLDGNLGYIQIGKIITIYPQTDELTTALATELVNLTKSFNGPKILTDAHLGGTIYTRYGGINPIVATNSSGQEERLIYNKNGELQLDKYTIPFILPNEAVWIFPTIKPPKLEPDKKILHKIYKPISFLKTDAKGNVIKAIYLKKHILTSLCVIKQGRQHMWSDEFGRDMRKRLEWQKQLDDELPENIQRPRILDSFEENDDFYLVMEFIKGCSLFDFYCKINPNCKSWHTLPAVGKKAIVTQLLNVIESINRLHELGYIHRDITPVNFIVTPKNKLLLIDIELAYSTKTNTPNPPFSFGTYGFMSPQQMTTQTPVIEDDIYGLGATMLTMLSGLSPTFLDASNIEKATNDIFFLLGDLEISKTISLSLASSRSARPNLTSIKDSLQNFKNNIDTAFPFKYEEVHPDTDKPFQIDRTIQMGINGLVIPPTVIKHSLWQSKVAPSDSLSGGSLTEYTTSDGLHTGVTGVLYFLARAKAQGYNIDSCLQSYHIGWEYIRTKYLKALPNVPSGLYYGAAGISLALATGMQSGLIEPCNSYINQLIQCLSLSSHHGNIADGVAGQIIALLKCRSVLPNKEAEHLLDTHLQSFTNYLTSKNKQETFSFSYGLTGTTWLLLECSIAGINLKQLEIARKDLLSKMTKIAGKIIKNIEKNGTRNLYANQTVCEGVYGLILALTNAYKLSNSSQYKALVEGILGKFPDQITYDNFSQEAGLSGLGEIYLEVHQTFKSDVWKQRAEWISNLLLHSNQNSSKDACSWLSNNDTFATADFMKGNSGILYFLMRCRSQNQLKYRIIG